MEEIEKIRSIVENHPKHYIQMLKHPSREELLDYIMLNTSGNSLPERIYTLLYGVSNVCGYNNIKKFKSVVEGYGFCGRASECRCASESVSENCRKSKSKNTEEEKAIINEKRRITVEEKYGVSNVGQLDVSRLKHSKVYQDKDRVDSIVSTIKETKFRNHGDSNFNNISKTKETYLNLGLTGPQDYSEAKRNPNMKIIKDKDLLSKYYPEKSIKELSLLFNVSENTLHRYTIIHGLRKEYSSSFEDEIVSYLYSVGVVNIVRNSRKLLGNGKEIDIFLPDYSLAIEFNGTYFHSEKYLNKNYHYEKFKQCEDKGIELYSIFSNSWEKNKEEWKVRIKNRIYGISNYSSNVNILLDFLEKNETEFIYYFTDNRYGSDEILKLVNFSLVEEFGPNCFLDNGLKIWDCGYRLWKISMKNLHH